MAGWTQADADRLRATIGTGRKSVSYEGKGTITYQDTGEMMKALKVMQAEVSRAAGVVRTRQVRIVSSSGY